MSELKDSSINVKAFSQKFCSLIGFANPSLFSNILATDRTFYRCTGIVTYLSCWENTTKVCKSLTSGSLLTNFSRFLLTSQVGFHAVKPLKIAVCCFYSITQNKADGLTSTINGRVLTNQGVVSKLFYKAQQLRVRCLNQS